MSNIFETARELQSFCDSHGWRSCFIGGIAVLRWGQPRVTLDVDLTLLTGFGAEAPFVDILLSRFAARIDGAREFALRNRILLLQSGSGVGIDVSLAALSFEDEVVERATSYSFGPDLNIRTCSAEDLIVMKLFASRPIDIQDAEGVTVRNRGQLQWKYIEAQLAPLAEIKDEPAILETFLRLSRL